MQRIVLLVSLIAPLILSATCPRGIQRTDGLIIIDVQNGFMEKFPIPNEASPAYSLSAEDTVTVGGQTFVRDGSVPVSGSSAIIPIIQNWTDAFKAQGAPIFVSVDWHPANHCSFCRNGTAGQPGFLPSGGFCTRVGPNSPQPNFDATGRCVDALAVRAFNAKDLAQWPDHCVEATFSSRISPFLQLPDDAIIVKKGFNPVLDSYSAFGGTLSQGWPQWNEQETITELATRPTLSQLLATHGVTRVFVMGLATDFCVKMTSIDAINERFGPVVTVTSASRGVTPESVRAAIVQMSKLGIWVTSEQSVDVEDVLDEVYEACSAEDPSPTPVPSIPGGKGNDSTTALAVVTALLACTTVLVGAYAFVVRRGSKKGSHINSPL